MRCVGDDGFGCLLPGAKGSEFDDEMEGISPIALYAILMPNTRAWQPSTENPPDPPERLSFAIRPYR